MNFYTVRDLRTKSKSIWENLPKSGEALITNNGKPTALIIDINEKNFEDLVKEIRRARATIAINNMRKTAEENGGMSDEEIENEIYAARKEIKKRKKSGTNEKSAVNC